MSEIALPSGRKIGPGHPTFIIAEVGSNFSSLQDCLTSIVAAKGAGADAAKFQLYDFGSLYGIKAQDVHVAGVLPLDWVPALKQKADAVGIEFMASCFSPGLVADLDPYVNIHKVASAEMTHVRILEQVNSFGKPVILSTGAHGEADIRQSLTYLKAVDTILMYCVAAYPTQEVDLGCIDLLSRFRPHVGYSDHTLDVGVIPRAAVDHGACVIEKHFSAVSGSFPDSGHSLSPDQFRRMVLHLRGEAVTRLAPTREESPMVLRHNRRLIATCDIPQGGILREGENFGIYRSLKDDTHAYSAFLVDHVTGRTALKDIKAGDGVGPGDV